MYFLLILSGSLKNSLKNIKIQHFKLPLSLILLLLLALPLKVFSQESPEELVGPTGIPASRYAAAGLSYDEIYGVPYLSDFVNSTIYLKDNSYKKIPLRYDMYKDKFEFEKEGKIYWLMNKDISYIKYGNDTILPVSSIDFQGIVTHYFVHGKGKYSLYIRKKINFIPGVEARGYIQASHNSFERAKDEFFIKMENSPLIEISRKKDLIKFLSGNQKALEFIKKSKINTKNEDDLALLVRYLNSFELNEG